jgi:hypothetical protein
VLTHRMIVSAEAAMNGRTPDIVLSELLNEVTVPVTG